MQNIMSDNNFWIKVKGKKEGTSYSKIRMQYLWKSPRITNDRAILWQAEKGDDLYRPWKGNSRGLQKFSDFLRAISDTSRGSFPNARSRPPRTRERAKGRRRRQQQPLSLSFSLSCDILILMSFQRPWGIRLMRTIIARATSHPIIQFSSATPRIPWRLLIACRKNSQTGSRT